MLQKPAAVAQLRIVQLTSTQLNSQKLRIINKIICKLGSRHHTLGKNMMKGDAMRYEEGEEKSKKRNLQGYNFSLTRKKNESK